MHEKKAKLSHVILQLGQAETAKVIWSNFVTQYPEVIGKENPYNKQIHEIFGDQGGYR